VVEGFGGIVQGLAKDVIGHDYPRYLPLLVFIFTWTWINNAIGLIPGFGSATDNMNTTLAMGLVAFVYYHFQGFRAHGIKYFQQLAGHLHGVMLILLGPAMFVIELISHAVRPVTLSIRLRTNIYADHAVFKAIAGAVNDLGKYLGEIWGPLGAAVGFLSSSLMPVPLIFLGLLVSTVQAFVFTLLTTVYVGMATAHEDDH
jgi:F-type H+-transporting ATPase subunit a